MSSNATLQQLPLYGRKYRLDIKFPVDNKGNSTVLTITDSSFEPEALRITFDVYTVARSAYWYAEISIYNLDQSTADQIAGNPAFSSDGIKEGMEVILSAGYQNGTYGVIWDGFVMQPIWDREDVVDFKLTLHCVLGLLEFTRNPVNRTYGAISQQELITRMMNDCFHPVRVDSISSAVTGKTLRGKTVFGNPKKYLDWIAAQSNASVWLDKRGISIASFKKDVQISTDDLIVYTPTTGLIGVPVQTQLGANFRLLLDSRVKVQNPVMQVKIDNTVIRQQKRYIDPNAPVGRLLDQDGQYVVAAVRYVGDTRGQEWYTEVTGLTSINGVIALLNLTGGEIPNI